MVLALNRKRQLVQILYTSSSPLPSSDAYAAAHATHTSIRRSNPPLQQSRLTNNPRPCFPCPSWRASVLRAYSSHHRHASDIPPGERYLPLGWQTGQVRSAVTHYLRYDDRNGSKVDQASVARIDLASPFITIYGTIQSSAGILSQRGVTTGRSRFASPSDAIANAYARASLAEFACMIANVAMHAKAIHSSTRGKSSTFGWKYTNCRMQ